MAWNLEEALEYYRGQGAPGNQTALVNLMKEFQQESGGALPSWTVAAAAAHYGVKESFLLAIIRRMPSLRLEHTHHLELCGGENCSRSGRLASFVRKTYGDKPAGFTWSCTGCMRQCNRGPNLKWDGVLYQGADEALVRSLIEGAD